MVGGVEVVVRGVELECVQQIVKVYCNYNILTVALTGKRWV